MSWFETIIVAVILLAAGLYLLLAASIIVTALVESRPVKSLVPADPDDPEQRKLGMTGAAPGRSECSDFDSNPYGAPGAKTYVEERVRAASQLGFTAPRLFKPVKGGIYKTRNALMVSRSGQILAVIRWGTTAAIRNEVTLLYSALEDGRYLLTSDRPTGTRTPGFYDDAVLWLADFDQLLRRHEERLFAINQPIGQFAPEAPLEAYMDILERRARLLVDRGEAYWVDPEQSAFRFTLKGALKNYGQTLSTKHVDGSLAATAR